MTPHKPLKVNPRRKEKEACQENCSLNFSANQDYEEKERQNGVVIRLPPSLGSRKVTYPS